MEKGIGIVKFRNLLKKGGFEIVKGHNIRLNGVCVGCSGFLKKIDNNDDRLIYFNTDNLINKILYRTAQHLKDYVGGINCYSETFDENLLNGINNLYKNGNWSDR